MMQQLHWRGPICISKKADLDTIIGPEVDFSGMWSEERILIEALENWLADTQEISDVQQATVRECERSFVLGDRATWVYQS